MIDDVIKWKKVCDKLGRPVCFICYTPMVNAYDPIAKKTSKHCWKTTCEHNKDLRLSIG